MSKIIEAVKGIFKLKKREGSDQPDPRVYVLTVPKRVAEDFQR